MPPINAGIAGVLLPPPDPDVLDVAAGAPVVPVAPPTPPAPPLAAPLPVADPLWSVPEAKVAIVVGEARLPVRDPEAVRELKPVMEVLRLSKDACDEDNEASKAASIELDAELLEPEALDVTEAVIDVEETVEFVLDDLLMEGALDGAGRSPEEADIPADAGDEVKYDDGEGFADASGVAGSGVGGDESICCCELDPMPGTCIDIEFCAAGALAAAAGLDGSFGDGVEAEGGGGGNRSSSLACDCSTAKAELLAS